MKITRDQIVNRHEAKFNRCIDALIDVGPDATRLEVAMRVQERISKERSDATAAGLRLRSEAGMRYSKEAPFGYEWSDNGFMRRNQSEWNIIQTMRALRQSGMSYRKIAQRMAEVQIAGRSGKPMKMQSIARILRRPLHPADSAGLIQ
jgi:hypothetical protein